MEGQLEPQPPQEWQNDTLIPTGVDVELAAQRHKIFEKFRAGKLGGEAAYWETLRLYWTTQQQTTPETNVYLMDATFEIAVEARLSSDISGDLWEKSREAFIEYN